MRELEAAANDERICSINLPGTDWKENMWLKVILSNKRIYHVYSPYFEVSPEGLIGKWTLLKDPLSYIGIDNEEIAFRNERYIVVKAASLKEDK
jgi:hypothetical protein